MLKKCSIRSSRDDPVAELHQPGVVERDEVHREPGAHRLARLRVAEHDPLAVGDAVDRPLAAGRELHHEQVGAALVAAAARPPPRAASPREPGRSFRSWCAPVDGRVEDAEAARAGREDGLEADRPAPGSRARAPPPRPRRRRSRAGSPAPRTPIRCSNAYVSALSFERTIVSGAETSTGDPGSAPARGEASRSNDDWGRRRRRPPARRLQDRVGEPGIGAGRHEVERVAEVAADRALGHVRPDEPHLALAVLAQRAQQRRRPGRAGCRDENGQRPHRSRNSRAQSSRLSARQISMPASSSPRRWRSSRARAAGTLTRPRSANGREAKTSAARSPSGPRSQWPLRRDEAELVDPVAHDRRQQVAERAAEDVLRPAAADQLAAGEREDQLDEAVVEERHARLDRVRHRVAVLVAQELGQAAPRQEQVQVRPQPVVERRRRSQRGASVAGAGRGATSAAVPPRRSRGQPLEPLGRERPRQRHRRRAARPCSRDTRASSAPSSRRRPRREQVGEPRAEVRRGSRRASRRRPGRRA